MNNIEPVFFTEFEIDRVLESKGISLSEDSINTITGVVNQRIKKLKDALDAEIARGVAGERNYARALGQIDGVKHAVEVLAGTRANWKERGYCD